LTRVDPTGALDHEYDVITDKNGTTTTVKTGNEGGDDVDIITYKDSDGNVTGGKSVVVQNTYSSGIDTRHTQDSDPTPGERNIHGSLPLDVKVAMAYANFATGGTSKVLSFATQGRNGKKIYSMAKGRMVQWQSWMKKYKKRFVKFIGKDKVPDIPKTHTSREIKEVDRLMEEMIINFGRKAKDSTDLPPGFGG